MRRVVRDNGLSIFFGVAFVAALVGQSLAGYAAHNEELAEHGHAVVGFWSFVFSSEFAVDVAENWQSEFLQFFLFILATVWLVQRGSPESKRPGQEGPDSDRDQRTGAYAQADSPSLARARGILGVLYSNSLLIAMGTIFVLSWFAQSLAGVVVFNSQSADHGRAPLSWAEYLVTSDFWNRSLQNWQSEFLAVGAMIAFSIFLRQRGSSESKPVGAPHAQSAIEGE
jgi:hypothetical protein